MASYNIGMSLRVRLYLMLFSAAIAALAFVLAPIEQPKIQQFISQEEPAALNDSHQALFKRNRVASLKLELRFQTRGYNGRLISSVKGMGSASFISPEGIVLTAYHVIEDKQPNDVIIAIDYQGREWEYGVYAFDAISDLAVLHPLERPLVEHYLPLSLHDPKSGETVLSIGNSNDDFLQPRLGRVTRLNVKASQANFASGAFEFTARLAPGDSGGPVLNPEGELVGVVSYISFIPEENLERSAQLIPKILQPLVLPLPYASFAIPVAKEHNVVAQLLAGQSRDVPVIGIYGADFAGEHGFTSATEGALVDYVAEESPAARAGFQHCQLRRRAGQASQLPPGCLMGRIANLNALPQDYEVLSADIITAVDGIRVRNFDDLMRRVRSHEVGEDVRISVQRGREQLELLLRLEARTDIF